MWYGMDVLTLDGKGILLAFVIAAVMLGFGAATSTSSAGGGWALGVFYIVSMIYFLVLSAIATRAGEKYKRKIKQYQTARGVRNVLANGLGPLIFVMLVFYASAHGEVVPAMVGFISSVAAVTSDKFSSEIGILDGTPTSIVTLKRIRKGESGGVTAMGLFAGLLSSMLIAIVLGVGYVLWFYPTVAAGAVGGNALCIGTCHMAIGNNELLAIIIIGTLAGFIGTLVDSFLGHFEEKGVGNKYTSNFLCSMMGGLAGIVLYALIVGI